MEKFKDYYKILGISSLATQEEIKTAYRKMAKKYHPDVNKTKEAINIFNEGKEAYDVLSDIDKRRKYDINYKLHFQSSRTKTSTRTSNTHKTSHKKTKTDTSKMFFEENMYFWMKEYLNRMKFNSNGNFKSRESEESYSVKNKILTFKR